MVQFLDVTAKHFPTNEGTHEDAHEDGGEDHDQGKDQNPHGDHPAGKNNVGRWSGWRVMPLLMR